MKSKLLLSLLAILLITCQHQPFPQGERLYQLYCSNCHMEHGGGLMSLYPPIANSDHFVSTTDRFACIVRYGMHDTVVINDRQYDVPMQGIPRLKAPEIANVYNYIRSRWYPNLPPMSEAEVRKQLANCTKSGN